MLLAAGLLGGKFTGSGIMWEVLLNVCIDINIMCPIRLASTRCCVYNFELLMMRGGLA
jgi:hypothetical protein